MSFVSFPRVYLFLPVIAILALNGGCGGGAGNVATSPDSISPGHNFPIQNLNITTSFTAATKLDHYPLNARFTAGRIDPWEMVKESSSIASREEVLAMLRENAYEISTEDGDYYFMDNIMGHRSPPVVRVVEGAGPAARAATVHAIDNINAWLPYDKHITIGDDLDEAAWHRFLRLGHDDGLGSNVIRTNLNADNTGGASGIAGYDFVIIGGEGAMGAIQHELLHAMGLNGGRTCYEKFGIDCNPNDFVGPHSDYSHVPVSEFPESEMAYASPHIADYGLSAIDGEVIQAMYTRENLWGDGNDDDDRLNSFTIRDHDISPASLGPWDDTVVRYSGDFEPTVVSSHYLDEVHVAFGVDWRNGMARPWANGATPDHLLSESGLTGKVTWSGELVGFTPNEEAVHGDASIQMNVETLNGRASFVNLEHWAAGATPSAPGTGAIWQDGDLHYFIVMAGGVAGQSSPEWHQYYRDVVSNNFRSIGGDDGYVSGRFVGDRHNVAIGILERADLTGAFGTVRQ